VRKNQEALNPNSCLNRAYENEMLFILMGRDPAAPVAIRAWIAERIRLLRNRPTDQQIIDAVACAEIMEKECRP
jgi:hypothetical protein